MSFFASSLFLSVVLGVQPQTSRQDLGAKTPQPPDALCETLFDLYIRGRMVQGADEYAATRLIVSRGRENGFMHIVLDEWRKFDEHTEFKCVRILGKALAIDATARDLIEEEKQGIVSQWGPTIALDEEVVDELLERARDANRAIFGHYVIAFARARDPRASEFFKSVLRDRENSTSQQTEQFHAAVGLAGLGEARGVEWLIEHSEDTSGQVYDAWPPRAVDFRISTCCQAALRNMSGEFDPKSKVEWQQWWRGAQGQFDKRRAVRLIENPE
jgi:hypothetical protein